MASMTPGDDGECVVCEGSGWRALPWDPNCNEKIIKLTQNPRVRKMFCPQFWGRKWLRQFHGRLENALFLQKKAHVHKIPHFGGGGGVFVFFLGGGGDSIFMGARILLSKDSKVTFGAQKVTFLVTFESVYKKGKRSLFSLFCLGQLNDFWSVAGRVFHKSSAEQVSRHAPEAFLQAPGPVANSAARIYHVMRSFRPKHQ